MALDVKRFIPRFVEEARDHLGRLEEGVAVLERGPADRENVNALFRSAHTLKGSSRMLKLLSITETAHQMEDLLGAMREGRLGYSPEIGRLLMRGVDALGGLVDRAAEGGELPPADEALCALLRQAAGGEVAAAAPVAADSAPVATEPPAPTASPAPTSPPAVTEPPTPTPLPAPAATPAPTGEARLKTPDTVRVRLSKLDELIKLMGEVVSSHARLRQRYTEIRELERRLGRLAAGGAGAVDWSQPAEQLHRFARALRDDVLTQETMMEELNGKALLMRMLPLAVVLDPTARLVRDLARSLGKEAECVVTGSEIELDRQLIDKLSDPLVHILRNAVDHGLEAPAARVAAGKPAHGRIQLSARQDGGWVVVEVSDDGAGLPVEKIRAKAVQRGLLGAEQAAQLHEEEVVDLIFLPGFSTSPIITDVSGRGVGMDVVKRTIVDDLQGVVSVATRPGWGTTFELRLPLSLAVMRVLQCQAGGMPFGFTAQYVMELIRLPTDEVMEVAGRRAIVLRNEFIPLAELAELLRLPPMERQPVAAGQRQELLLVVVRVRHEKLGLLVEELLDEGDMVIKPLPDHLRRLPLVSGMVVTGRNELVSILHVPALLEAARSARGEGVGRRTAPAEAGAVAWRVLVVDDSLNTREIEKDVLEAHGFRVTLAEDGLDGFQKAMAGEFDAILTDVEMPNLDGFSLTERLRREEKHRRTPIVIITSREKEEDKRRGIQVGADAYIVKGDFDQNNLVDTLGNLLGLPHLEQGAGVEHGLEG